MFPNLRELPVIVLGLDTTRTSFSCCRLFSES